MLRRVPKKNIVSRLVDILRPRRAADPAPLPPIQLTRAHAFSPLPRSSPARLPYARYAGVVAVLAIITALFFVGDAYRTGHRALPETTARMDSLREHLVSYGLLEPDAASGDAVPPESTAGIGDIFRNIGGFFQAYRDTQTLSTQSFSLFTELDRFTTTGLSDALAGRGDTVRASLARITSSLRTLSTVSARLKHSSSFQSLFPIDDASAFRLELTLQESLRAAEKLTAWVNEPRERRIAVFLENPAELRPGGGFIGSYIDLRIQGGAIVGSEIHDILDADTLLAQKIIPPPELRGLVRSWRAADANWFFDYGQSASTTLSLLEASDLYRKQSVSFDGALSLAPPVIADLLRRTGPMTLSDGTVLDADSFLRVIQARVQEAQAADAPYPKAILTLFGKQLLAAFSDASSPIHDNLQTLVRTWILNKDLRFFFRDADLETLATRIGADGNAFAIPSGYQGDYLAVYAANVGGGKSDLVTVRDVSLESQVQESSVSNRLTIHTAHRAKNTDPWWYREPSETYLQIVIPRGSQITYALGGSVRRITPRVRYDASYISDPILVSLASTTAPDLDYPELSIREAGNVMVVGTWVTVSPGTSHDVVLSYEFPLVRSAPDSEYRFVGDRQSSAQGAWHVEISAPLGFVFRENNLPTYIVDEQNPPGRFSVPLTLRKLQGTE